MANRVCEREPSRVDAGQAQDTGGWDGGSGDSGGGWDSGGGGDFGSF
jgi:hypothetical protein